MRHGRVLFPRAVGQHQVRLGIVVRKRHKFDVRDLMYLRPEATLATPSPVATRPRMVVASSTSGTIFGRKPRLQHNSMNWS